MRKRILTLLLAAVLMLGLLPTRPVSAAQENTYTLTGNQRKDILGVALTQMGYVEGSHNGKKCGNDTKYGMWMGYEYQAWCAMFVSWCARQADIPESILQNSCKASPQGPYFNIAYYSGTEYTPQPGDLFFKPEFSHVGLVYEVKGDIVVTIEGNVNYDDDENDGFTVCFRERKISESIFGVPAYEGCDTCPATGGEHTYKYSYNTDHPHANYFKCSACGDTNYTGTNHRVTSCTSCMKCSCSTAYAGYYQVSLRKERYLNLRTGHGGGYPMESVVQHGEIVEVVAGDGKWAHIAYGPYLLYASMGYLKRYVPTPGAIKSDASGYYDGQTAYLSWGSVKYAAYNLTVTRDGTTVIQEKVNSNSYQLNNLKPGNYQITVTAQSGDTVSGSVSHGFQVTALHKITYDGRGGTNVPDTQEKVHGKAITLSSTVPEKDGYQFLGWNDSASASYAITQPGSTWEKDKDVTLYAIWRAADAVPASLKVNTLPSKQVYMVGDPLNTAGLKLELVYSDGSSDLVTTGFEISGFSSETEAEVTVTVTYQGFATGYTVQVLDCIPGDIDLNLTVDKEDVMLLLWHISFPDMFPIDAPADFTGDGLVDKADVMQLLWHISFPDMFSLM